MISAFFQGFSPILPVIIILSLLVISLLISWWSYAHIETVTTIKKWGLISLRGSALFILVLLLLNPFLTEQFTTSEKPSIAVYLDNSQSMSIERGEYAGAETYNNIINDFEQSRTDDFNYTIYYFDSEIRENTELDLSGTSTNLHRVIEHAREFETAYSAAFLFSDGIVTQGRDPVFSAQHLQTPIITVPVGDTSRVMDIALSDINFTTPVYTNTEHIFGIELQQEGYEGESVPVHFSVDGERIETQNIDFNAPSTSHDLDFTLTFENDGFYEIEISTPVQPEELTGQNNSSSVSVEVLDDKTNILSIAFEVHPDVSSIRRLIATDQQNELFSSTVIGEERFVGVDPREIEEDMELIVLLGLPESNSALYQWILEQSVPVLYVATPSSFQYKTDSNIINLIGYSMSGRQGFLPLHIQSFEEQRSHPVLEVNIPNLQRLPTLQSTMGNYSTSANSETLLMAEYQRNPTDIPLLIVEDASSHRIASVNAFGWYRFDHHSNREVRDFYRDLFTNLVSWTSTTPDRRTLTLEPTKDSFTENEPVQMRATLFNERGEPEPEAFIEIEISREDDPGGESSVFRMNHHRNENYRATLSNYPEGIYRVSATAVKNNRTIGTAETNIRVSTSTVEFLNTKRDDEMLRQLATLTDGLFLENVDFTRANQFLQEGDFGEIRQEITTDYLYIHEFGWAWFSLVLILLSAEWLLRRSVSLP